MLLILSIYRLLSNDKFQFNLNLLNCFAKINAYFKIKDHVKE